MTPTATITLSVKIPVNATAKQIEEWVRYEMHMKREMSPDNPLINRTLYPKKLVEAKITK